MRESPVPAEKLDLGPIGTGPFPDYSSISKRFIILRFLRRLIWLLGHRLHGIDTLVSLYLVAAYVTQAEEWIRGDAVPQTRLRYPSRATQDKSIGLMEMQEGVDASGLLLSRSTKNATR